jgi:hypothetical protein
MTELGEGASITPVRQTPDKYLHAKVVEVTFEGGYKTCRKKTTVQPPHWPAKADGPNQSQKPAVFPFAHKGTQKAKVKIKIESRGYSGNGKLRGILKTLEFEGDIPLAAGEHTVETTLKEPPDATAWVKGPMSWGIESPDISVLAGTPLTELFFVFDDPGKMRYFKDKGVWIEALRFLFRSSKVAAKNKDKEAVAEVTKCCFGLSKHEYDINGGEAHFIPNENGSVVWGKFGLTEYIRKSKRKSLLNCYDQAYAVVVLSGALGLRVHGLFLDPFGFLSYMELVGRGPCNNPFPSAKFEHESRNPNGSKRKKRLKKEDFLVVDGKDPYRSGFGNHMFCEFGRTIYDACAGPAKGGDDRLGYLRHSVDVNGPEKKRLDLPGGRIVEYDPYVRTGWPKTDQEIVNVSVRGIRTIDELGLAVSSLI